MRKIWLCFLCFFCFSFLAFSQAQDDHDPAADQHGDQPGHHDHATGACGQHHEEGFNPGAVAFHHISDQNVYSIGPLQLPLPVITYVPDHGVDFFSSGRLDPDSHGIGRKAYDRYVLFEGQIKRITDDSFPMGEVELGDHAIFYEEVDDPETNKKRTKYFVCYNDTRYPADSKSTIDGGLLGGGITSFYDFSISKNVVSMFLVFLFLAIVFIRMANTYKKREGQAPSGVQGFIEPIFVFIQDEVAKPFLGHRWQEFLPFIMSIFFFILALNLFGQIPFFGNSNVTGNLSVTLVLAVIAFIVTNINGNRHYWQHVFSMPGIPGWVKVIVTPVEILGLFIKPITLMLRLFGNMTAGHMVVVIFVGLIFIFGEAGAKPGLAWGSAIPSALLTLFIMAIELLVAFIQAFVFAILTASYIGAATEEHHH